MRDIQGKIMSLKGIGRRLTSPNPRLIEVTAILSAIVVVTASGLTIFYMSQADLTREKILSVLSVGISALGVASLLFLWAQLRHTAIQDKLVAYHEHFQDLPRGEKVNAVYTSMGRIKLERPIWQRPLSAAECDQIFADNEPAPHLKALAF
jgi:hypothetical protein